MSSHPRHEPLRDSKSSLYEAAVAAVKAREEALRAEAARKHALPRQRRHWHVLMLLLILTGAGLLIVRPEWLTGPRGLVPEPPEIAVASMRLTLLRERQRVRSFERTRGHLPVSLGEAGSPFGQLGFDVFPPDAFQIWGKAGDSIIKLRSTDSMGTFLGNSLRVLKQRVQP